ncbi:Nuf2-domain-containing protein [Rhizoclosmatium globosum]|uniref:Nuf2-domain-containing protein n=1 Tax=Rhizoclosmatium globosum TaxID=329046 RepID=A0A1Y2B7C8_9FUNG|nr:Nuf2-domain-containing protein [Rhizoclosmatium globosum]|eukprot:ORY30450.1 Nuf2-domain-containing protein [Rhizoclosmatium globosum]
MSHTQGSYSFPILKPSEIVACMADLQIPLSLEDLEKPSPQRMIAVFEAFTDVFMGVSRDQFVTPNFHVMEMLEHPELHQEDVTLMGFYRQLFKLVTEVGISDFSIRDLIKPEPGHMRKILSGIINFAKFREERLSVFEQCTQKSEEYVKQKAHLQEKNQEIAERVNTMRLQRAEEEPAYQRVRERNLALTAELRELKRIQTAMTGDIENLKKHKNETIEKMNNTQFLLSNCKQDCTRLRSRIVPNPEKLQQALVDMTNSIASEKASLASREKQYRELLSKMEAMTSVQQDLVMCTKLMEECEFEMKKASTAANKLASEQENTERKKQELHEVTVRETQLKRQLANITEKLGRLEKQQTMKKEANDARMKELCAEYDESVKERDITFQRLSQTRSVLRIWRKRFQT